MTLAWCFFWVGGFRVSFAFALNNIYHWEEGELSQYHRVLSFARDLEGVAVANFYLLKPLDCRLLNEEALIASELN